MSELEWAIWAARLFYLIARTDPCNVLSFTGFVICLVVPALIYESKKFQFSLVRKIFEECQNSLWGSSMAIGGSCWQCLWICPQIFQCLCHLGWVGESLIWCTGTSERTSIFLIHLIPFNWFLTINCYIPTHGISKFVRHFWICSR